MSVLDSVAFPAQWKPVRLGAVAPRVSEAGFGGLEPLSVFLGEGVVPRSSREDNHNQLGADLEKYQRVLPGDLVFNKLRTWQGGFGVSAFTGIVSPAYIIARPTPEVVPGYLHHLMRSEPFLSELTRLSKWMPPSQFDIAWEDIRSLELKLPPIEEQRRIADFLDDQVARISALRSKREMQHLLVTELLDLEIDKLVWADAPSMPLRHLAREIVVGIVVQPASYYTKDDAGVPAVRGTDISIGHVDTTDLVKITQEGHALHPRSKLGVGDVLVVRTGMAGVAAVVPEVLVGANTISNLVVRPVQDASPQFLEAVINCYRNRQLIQQNSVGAMQQHFGVEAMKALDAPQVSLEEQVLRAEQVGKLRKEMSQATDRLVRGIAVLDEYQRSLITAAVTGELDVSTAGSGVPA